jgi:YgiT-type zinc finger domain-containing protein
MYHCHVCGSTESRDELLSEVFWIDRRPVLVDDIPARVCVRCGEATVSRETTEAVRQLVHGKSESARLVQMPVFSYA